jgi:hypothetical protein
VNRRPWRLRQGSRSSAPIGSDFVALDPGDGCDRAEPRLCRSSADAQGAFHQAEDHSKERRTLMNTVQTYRRNASWAGIFFIIATAFLFVGEAFYGPALKDPDILTAAAGAENDLTLGVLIEFAVRPRDSRHRYCSLPHTPTRERLDGRRPCGVPSF